MYDVFGETAEIWNERLASLMENNVYQKKFTQASLAKAMNAQYADDRGTLFTQKGVGRWLKVGVYTRSKKGHYGFPEYETMLYIADFFHVDVGYLTGETDYKRFNTGAASDYLGICEKSTEQIRRLTQAESRYLSPFTQFNRIAFDHLLTSDDFFYLVNQLREMYSISPVSGVLEDNKQDHFEAAMNYRIEVNESLSLSRFKAYEIFFNLLDNLYPYAKNEDFLIPDEVEED